MSKNQETGWYQFRHQDTATDKIDNVVRINGNNFTNYNRAIEYIEKSKKKESETTYSQDVGIFGFGYAILKYCQANDKYYSEKILKTVLYDFIRQIY